MKYKSSWKVATRFAPVRPKTYALKIQNNYCKRHTRLGIKKG